LRRRPHPLRLGNHTAIYEALVNRENIARRYSGRIQLPRLKPATGSHDLELDHTERDAAFMPFFSIATSYSRWARWSAK
jgi:hypothetical protein